MTENEKRITALLREAAAKVEEAAGLLDLREEESCSSCGARHFLNRAHALVAERVSETPKKLRNAVALLQG